jgi:polyketide synthase 12/myxalamid-type polyketide synthase MxaB
LGLLAPGGRFLEIGKSGLLTPEQAAALGQNRRYFAVDWTPDALQKPALIRGLLDQVLAEIAAGQLQPLPHRSFALAAVARAFRYMAQARHIGKIVVLADTAGNAAGEERLSLPVRPSATYLITGGLRGLGLLTAGWLAQQGAEALALIGRSAPDAAANAAIAQLRAGGCRVLVMQADVSRRAELERVLAAIAEQLPPLAGVVHAAGVLDDGALIQQNWPRFAAVMAPKVQGAWHLHQLTEQLSLDFFVLFSSVAALLGSAGQGNHSAANAFLDALAHYRRSVGLPAVSINWGIWSEVGIAAALAVGAQRSGQGLGTISPQNGLQVLGWLLEQQPIQIGVTPMTWPAYLRSFAGGGRRFFARVAAQAGATAPAARRQEEIAQPGARTGAAGLLDELAALAPAKRRARLIEFIKTQTGQVLGLDGATCSERTPLSEMGLDSLMAVELRNVLSRRMGLKRPLPATLVFDYPTIQAIADFLLRDVLAFDADPGGAQADRLRSASSSALGHTGAQASAPALLDDLESLSDEEVERRLAQQFS